MNIELIPDDMRLKMQDRTSRLGQLYANKTSVHTTAEEVRQNRTERVQHAQRPVRLHPTISKPGE